jgi:hypothetical protein
MRAGERLALAIVLGVAVLTAGAAGAATYAWHAGGTVRVAVHAAGPDGTDVNVRMPGVLLNAAIALCPTPRVLDDPQARAALAAVGSAADQLATMPDAVLLDVREEGSRVRVEKSGGRLLIRVRETRDWVDIDVPIRSVRFLAEKLGRAARVPAAV